MLLKFSENKNELKLKDIMNKISFINQNQNIYLKINVQSLNL